MDIDKTKQQLTTELVTLRQRITQLENVEAELRQAEARTNHLNLIIRAIRSVNQLLVREKDRGKLLKGACDNLTENRGYYNAWIAIFDDAGRLLETAETGLDNDFAPMLDRLSNGALTACAQEALGKQSVVTVKDTLSTCSDCPLAHTYYGRGAMISRLEYGEKVYGILCVSIPTDLTEDVEERSLLAEVAEDIAFGLYNIEIEEQHKQMDEELHRQWQEMEIMFDYMPACAFYTDREGRHIRVNKALADLTGIPKELWVGKTISELLPNLAKQYEEDDNEVIKLGEPKRNIIEPFETPEGTRWAQTDKIPIKDIKGNVIGMIGLSVDITERRRAHEAQSLLASIVESSDDAIIGEDLDAVITSWNTGAERIYGYSAEEAIGRPASMLVPPGNPDDVADYLKRIKAGERVDHYETVRMKKNGEQIDVSLTMSPIEDEESRIIGASAIARDVTESKRMQDNMRFYIEEITKSQENERMRIARELHDETIQALILLARDIDEISSSASGITTEERVRLEELWERINGVAEDVRRMSQDLRPDALDRLGLLSALKSMAISVTERSGIVVQVQSSGVERRVAREMELLLFRLVQEALSNVERHAQATSAQIIVEFQDSRTKLIVKDNGQGFRIPAGMGDLAKDGKLGLIGMQERASLLGGTISVESELGRGTVVTVEAPV